MIFLIEFLIGFLIGFTLLYIFTPCFKTKHHKDIEKALYEIESILKNIKYQKKEYL